jgi:hypothetical protein
MPAVCRSRRISRLPPSISGKTRHTGAPDSAETTSSVSICTFVPVKQAKQRQYLYFCTDKKQTNCAPAEKARRGRRFGCVHAPSTYTPYVSIRQHTSRQHPSAYVGCVHAPSTYTPYVSIRQHTSRQHPSAYVGCVHAPSTYTPYVSIRQHTSGACMRPAPIPHTSASVSIRRVRACAQHLHPIRQHPSAYVGCVHAPSTYTAAEPEQSLNRASIEPEKSLNSALIVP